MNSEHTPLAVLIFLSTAAENNGDENLWLRIRAVTFTGYVILSLPASNAMFSCYYSYERVLVTRQGNGRPF